LKLIYKARDIIEAHIIAGLLKSNNIDAYVGGHYLQGGIGDLAAMEFATINVADEDVVQAKKIISEYEGDSNITDNSNTNNYITPLIVFTISLFIIYVAAVLYGDN
jgi:hypothetical protein